MLLFAKLFGHRPGVREPPRIIEFRDRILQNSHHRHRVGASFKVSLRIKVSLKFKVSLRFELWFQNSSNTDHVSARRPESYSFEIATCGAIRTEYRVVSLKLKASLRLHLPLVPKLFEDGPRIRKTPRIIEFRDCNLEKQEARVQSG